MKISNLLSLGAFVAGVTACGDDHLAPDHPLHKKQEISPYEIRNQVLKRQAIDISSSSSVTSSATSVSASTSASTSASSSAGASTSASTSVSSGTTLSTSTRTSTSSTRTSSTSSAAAATSAVTVKSTILVIARDAAAADQASSGLNAYGIPFQTLLVPQDGVALPALNTSGVGNFGGFILVSGIAYYYTAEDQWHSALTNDQMNQLYAYQTTYGVRMVQYDAYPQPAYGTTALGGCCGSGVEQLVSFTNTTAFTQAGLKTGAGMSTQGLYHYPATISDTKTTVQIAQFGAGGSFSNPTTAAVINYFQGREQMAFFINWATEWSPTSQFLQHAAITWITRGLYAGYRRVNLGAQVDDMMLPTGIYYPGNSATTYRLTVDDMNTLKTWSPKLQAKMNPGSTFKLEIGHNGNGVVRAVDATGSTGTCSGGPIYVRYDSTPLEFQKVLGTGTNGWPSTPSTYPFSDACLKKDPLSVWFSTASNRDAFMHISHTFTHQAQNNATYSDIYKEISWNQRWFKQTSIGSGSSFSANGLIPPQITGLHNGDALKAWSDNGITNAVGDNSRPPLRNQDNDMWPYITNVANNGFNGMLVIPRWSLRIYYDCDTPACTTQEWKDKTGTTGDFDALMGAEKFDVLYRLFGLYHDSNMFHQLNLRSQGMSPITTADGTQVNSLIQAWTEQAVQEFNKYANWPMVTLKQSDLATSFANRMTRDKCQYSMSYTMSRNRITAITVNANGNTCAAPIPITVPGTVTSTQGFTTEKLGNDPLTIWVKLSGKPVTFTLSSPVVI